MAETTTATAPHLRLIELKPVDSVGELTPIDEPFFVEEVRPSFIRRWALFIGLVVIPVVVGGGYFAFLASDQYASEASYFVRASASTEGGGGPMNLFSPPGSYSRSVEDTHALNEYLRSRDMVDILIKQDKLREILGRPEGDFVARFPNFLSKNTQEAIYEHFRRIVSVTIDGTTGISVLEVRTFNPDDSKQLAEALLKHGEALINKLNARAHEDAVRVAQAEVKLAEMRLEDLQVRMTEFRNTQLILDPLRQSTSALDAVAKMAGEVARQQAQLAQILAMAPNSPQAQPIRESIKALQGQIELQRSDIVGGDRSLSAKLGAYDRISLERELATKSLASALASLESARREGQKQQLYLETIVQPHLSDLSTYPKRLLMFLLILGSSLSLYWIVHSMREILREHQA